MIKKQLHLILLTFLLADVLSISAWVAHMRFASAVNQKTGESLVAVLNTAHQAIKSWAEQEKSTAIVWANNDQYQDAILGLLNSTKNNKVLINSPHQKIINSTLKPLLQVSGYQGYFVIDRNNISIASSRNINIGTVNLLSKQKEFLEKIWSGECALSLPVKSDVPLADEDGVLRENLPTMFVGAPVFNKLNQVVAVFALRINPYKNFTAILQQGRLGKSGETYAFSRDGTMISLSRFSRQVYEIGLLSELADSSSGIVLRDPGVNLVKGEKSHIAAEKQALTYMVQQAIKNGKGLSLEPYRDYRGVPVYGAWLWDEDLQLGIATEIDVDEARETIAFSGFTILLLAAISILLLVLLMFAFLMSRKLLLKSSQELKSIIEKSPVAMVLTDAVGNIELFNRSFIRQFGWTTNDVKTPDEWWHAAYPDVAYREKVQNSWEQAVQDAQNNNTEIAPQNWSLVCKNGDVRDVEFKMIPVTNAISVISMHDLTDMNRAMAALQYERDRSKRYLDTVDVTIVALDINGQVTLINRAGCELLGYNEASLIGQNWFETCVPADDKENLIKDVFDKLIAGDASGPEYIENEIITHSGERRLLAWRNVVLKEEDENENISGVLSAGTDITEIKKSELERQQLQSQLLSVQKAEAIGQLSAGVAHNFNNMLTSIIGFTELARQKTSSIDDDALDQYFAEVLNNSRRARDLVEQVQRFSRKAHTNKELLKLQDIVLHTMELLMTVLPSGIEVDTHLDQQAPAVFVDKMQLQQVIIDLAVNASDAMNDNGILTIDVQQEKIDEQVCDSCHENFSGEFVVLSVQDQGEGMKDSVLEHIFNPFFTTKEIGKGTGMGLSTVHGIVHLHNGHLHVKSELAEGSVFLLYFPVTAE